MKRLIKSLSIILFILTAVLLNSSVSAETMQVPQWYNLKATLEEPPVVGKSVGLNVELQISNIQNTRDFAELVV